MSSFIGSLRKASIDVVGSVGTIASSATVAISALGHAAEQFQRTSSEHNAVHKYNTPKRLQTLAEEANANFAKEKKQRAEQMIAEGINYQEIESQSEKDVEEILKLLNGESDS